MYVFLLIAAVIILICVFFNKLSQRLGIPALLVFILLGMFFGTDGVIKIPFDNFELAEQVCSFALVFIMFYGGFGTKWSEARPAALRASLLSTVGVIMTASLTGIFCRFVLGTSMLEGLLIGAVISSTDAASVFSVLRSKKLDLKYNTASLLEIESGSNDPCAYMLTVILLSVMGGSASSGRIIWMIFTQLVFGAGFGIITALASIYILKKFRFSSDGFDTIFVFAAVIVSYALPSALGGNGYLATYIFGIMLGNSRVRNKKSLVHFFDGVTGLMQMLLFFLLGLLSFPSKLPHIILPSLAIALCLTLVIRPITVFAILAPFKCRINQMLLVSFAGLRGAASIVFAILTDIKAEGINSDIFHMVFFIVLFSILMQGTFLPLAAKKLNMIDESGNVMKTFNDYTDEVPVQFIQFTVGLEHPWAGMPICDILLPPETLFVQLRRGSERITPDGSTVIAAGDTLILSAKASSVSDGVNLTEKTLSANNSWIGKNISSIDLDPGKLVIMIQRGNDIVIPNGNTVLELGDKLVINQYEL